LLDRRNLVPARDLEWKEIGKALLVSIVAGLLSWKIAQLVNLAGSRVADIKVLGLILATWCGAVAFGLWITKSQLPADLRRKS